uniref:uncharacterized protein LOC117703217 n=1 Tax=Arvicanthis niloticus TaxID=61156 RepID=UPI0014869D93|nr:uncharacterized protein LOC117703217 [Arvicanthis niloticus]
MSPSRPAPPHGFCSVSGRLPARALRGRPEKGHSRARACRGPPKRLAEGCGVGRRETDGQQRSGILQPAAHTRPPAPLTRAHSREERTFARVPRRHSPKATEGRTETRRTRLRQARATIAQLRTAIPGTARRDSQPTREAAAGASAGERRKRAVRAGGHHLASTPPAPIYSPFRAPRDLPSLAPARSPASDMTQPQDGRARLAG